MKLLSFFIFLFSALCFFLSCNNPASNSNYQRQPYTIPDSLLKTLVIDSVKQGVFVNAVTVTGQVDFNQDRQVNIFPMVSGNVQDIKVQLGDYIHSGQALAVIKSSEMAGYNNNLVVAETNVITTKKQLDALQDLFNTGLASQLDLTTAQANYQQATSQLEMAKRVLKINGDNTQGEYIVKSPISGFIVQKLVTNQQVIRTDNGNALFTVSDLKDVWVWANVYESNLAKINLGDSVHITTLTYPGRIFKGRVDKIMHVLDPGSKVTKVRIMIANPDYALRPQMYASITVTNTIGQPSLYVDTSALVFDHSQYYVLTYHGHGEAHIRPVQIKGFYYNKAYIAEGAKQGEQVISSNALLIYNQLNN